jgi:2-oxoglutarate dehydrogenase E2 component (dihydrolipoamide succinyltransferase)
MATDVVMPQMGESVAEGTIVRWLKKVGDSVERDEPLFEISTDKIDAEIPAPAAGVLTEIMAKEGETVGVNTVVAVIGSAGEVSPVKEISRVQLPHEEGGPAKAERHAEAAQGREGEERSSPLVRRMAKEHGVDISKITGTGTSGRVTKDDVLGYLGQVGQVGRVGQVGQVGQAEPAAPKPPEAAKAGRTEKMSPMRKKIAEHLVLSRRTSAHVHSVFEVDFTHVAQARQDRKVEYEQAGVKLTFLSFVVKAAAAALRAVPVVNASVEGENIVYHKDVNIGVAVALDWGLIVPVIRHADEQNLVGISRSIADLAGRARSKQLKPEEVGDGTFTITNPGVFGTLFGLPIINQPQVAILCMGSIAKRPVVRNDTIAIRLMAYVSLGYDHRIVDGAVADEFMSHVKQTIENWDANG